MNRIFVQTREFSSKWEELDLDDEDLRLLELEIINSTFAVQY